MKNVKKKSLLKKYFLTIWKLVIMFVDPKVSITKGNFFLFVFFFSDLKILAIEINLRKSLLILDQVRKRKGAGYKDEFSLKRAESRKKGARGGEKELGEISTYTVLQSVNKILERTVADTSIKQRCNV